MESSMYPAAPKPDYPKISVVMAAYNAEKYLRQAMDSILGQTFTNFEFVIVEDGSTDETSQILACYQDPRILIIKNEHNMGLTKSLNRGINASHGELIARQDADDISLPERLSVQSAFLDLHPQVGLVGSGCNWIDGQGNVIREWIPISGVNQIQRTLLSSVPFLHGTFMFRRSCLVDNCVGYDDEIPVAQDCDLLMRISEFWDLDNIQEILYLYRTHSDAISAKRSNDQAHYLEVGRTHAVQRRLEYGLGRLGIRRVVLPERLQHADRRWLAERFALWSASARMFSKTVAFQFLVIALLLDPTAKPVWEYLSGILHRKIRAA
jgi:glycosyltransferase involved in cell wall biosynthesis